MSNEIKSNNKLEEVETGKIDSVETTEIEVIPPKPAKRRSTTVRPTSVEPELTQTKIIISDTVSNNVEPVNTITQVSSSSSTESFVVVSSPEKSTEFQVVDHETESELHDVNPENTLEEIEIVSSSEVKTNSDVIEDEDSKTLTRNTEETLEKLAKLELEEAMLEKVEPKSFDSDSDQSEHTESNLNQPSSELMTSSDNDKATVEETIETEQVSIEPKKVTVAKGNKPEIAKKPKTPTPPVDTIYPTDLNPFGEEDEEEVKAKPQVPSKQTKPQIYPTDLNPFGDEDGSESEQAKTTIANESLNPFGDFDDEEEVPVENKKTPIPIINIPQPTPRKATMSNNVKPKSPTSRSKKRPAPAPPSNLGKSTQSLNSDHNQPTSLTSSFNEHDSGSANSSVASSRAPTPVPRRTKQSTTPTPTRANDTTTVQNSTSEKLNQIKLKKRPAPPIPAYKRELKLSTMDDIEAELNEIGDELPSLEVRRIELEKWLLDKQNQGPPSSDDQSTTTDDSSLNEYEERKQEFIGLVKKRCKMSQKQKELMYMKREHKLEETQVDIEFKLRKIMSKQDAQKDEKDKETETELLQHMMEIIDERNDIIENMIKDENKEIEEYLNIIGRVLPDQVKAMTPTPLSSSTSVDQSNPIQIKSHKSASKLLKEKTASTLLKLKKFKKKKKLNKKSTKTVDDVESEVDDDDDHDEEDDGDRDSEITSTTDDSKLSTNSSHDSLSPNNASPVKMSTDETNNGKKAKKSFNISKSTFKKLTKLASPGGSSKNNEVQQQQSATLNVTVPKSQS